MQMSLNAKIADNGSGCLASPKQYVSCAVRRKQMQPDDPNLPEFATIVDVLWAVPRKYAEYILFAFELGLEDCYITLCRANLVDGTARKAAEEMQACLTGVEYAMENRVRELKVGVDI